MAGLSTSDPEPAAAGLAGGPAAGVLVATLCLAEVLGMAATSSFPALQPLLMAEWRLTNTAAGWLNGAFYGGYVVAVAVLVSLTDRVDARRIYLASMAASAAAALAFALVVDGFWSALLWRAVAGAGLAGTYMPGLRILSDRLTGPRATRYMALYTAAYAIGSAASTLLSGTVGDALGWRWAHGVAALGPVAAFILAAAIVPSTPPRAAAAAALLDFRPVLRNRPAVGYILGYACHCWELFGFQAWVVTFLVFAAGAGGPDLSVVTLIVTAVLLLGVPASILGNEAALRFGRRRFVVGVMLVSAAVAVATGFSGGLLPFAAVALLAVLHGALVMADSASLTVGAVTAADPAYKGATLAVHSLLGFGAAAVAPLAFGLILDGAGGGTEPAAWGFAFLGLAAGAALGPVALRLTWPRDETWIGDTAGASEAGSTCERSSTMTANAKTIGLIILGWSFVLLGIAGLFLPFLQGFLFLFIGLIILARVHTWARALVVRARRRFPAVNRAHAFAERQADAWRRRARRLFGR